MRHVDLLNGPIDSTLRKFATPLILSFVLNMVYAWIDMYFISRLGNDNIAAVGMSEQLMFLIFSVAAGLSVGSGIIISRRIGEGNKAEADYTATQGLMFMLIFSTLLAVIMFLLKNKILMFMGLKGSVLNLAEIYMSAIVIGVPFNFVIFQINSMSRSAGDSMFSMFILIFTLVLNAIFAPIFIFGVFGLHGMGIFGAGLATTTSLVIGSIIAFISVVNKKSKIKLVRRGFKPDFTVMKQIARLGLPASLQMLVVSFSRMSIAALAVSFGTNILTTYTLGLRVDLFVFMTIFAVGTAIEVITGQNLGAGKIRRIFQYHRSAIFQVSALMLVLGPIVYYFSSAIGHIFNANTVVNFKLSQYLKIMSFSYLFFGVGIISMRVISGAGDYYRSLKLVAIILFFVQISSSYILSKFTPLMESGIWLGMLFSQILFAGFSLLVMSKKSWITKKI